MATVIDFFKRKAVEFLTSAETDKPEETVVALGAENTAPQTEALYAVSPSTGGNFMFSINYDGEKNIGEAGPIINYFNDYAGMRARSWQLYYESEIAQTIIRRSVIWVISRGLRLEAQPNETVLQSEGYIADREALKGIDDIIESRWKVWAKSKRVSYDNQMNLAGLAKEQQKNKYIAGDVLVILRYKKKQLTVQLIDGACVKTPYGIINWADGMPIIPGQERVVNGVVIDDKGAHLAYYVQTTAIKFERIEAKSSKTGMLMAYMVYGLKYRLNNTRGVPMLAVSIESANQIDRYKTATLANAEETAKIVIGIQHEAYSDGSNPLTAQLAEAVNAKKVTDIPKDMNGIALENKVAATTGKTAINLPVGGKLTKLDHTAEVHYKEFYDTNANAMCSTGQIPPEVAFMKYESNFSSSRAALKDWEHTILVNREETADDFYQPIYNLWLFIEIMSGKINLPGYIRAFQEQNTMAIDAYQETMWKGPTVPHIDPLKEVTAVRAMLGENGASIPLTTAENATEMLNQGDYDENIKQFAEELQDAKDQNVYIEPVRGGGGGGGEDANANPPKNEG